MRINYSVKNWIVTVIEKSLELWTGLFPQKDFDLPESIEIILKYSFSLKLIYIKQIKTMAERKAWTTYEDNALKTLKEVRKIKKWSLIATLLESQYGITDRNGKQCRERYHNHLDTKICNLEWSPEENEELVLLHNKMGNRWASIARCLPGRTDNCVKNRLYSLLRKGLRIINDLRENHFGVKLQPLKPSFIYQIIKTIEKAQKKNQGNLCEERTIEAALKLKEKILQVSIIDTEKFLDEIEIQNIQNYLGIFQKKNYSSLEKYSVGTSEEQREQKLRNQQVLKKKSSLHIEILQSQQFNDTLGELSLRGISSFFDQKYFYGYESQDFEEVDDQALKLKEPEFPYRKNSLLIYQAEENLLL